MLIGLTVVNFSEKCWSHRKNYEWRLNLYFVHNFNSYIFVKVVRIIVRRDFFLQQEKYTPVQGGDGEETFFNKKNGPQCKRGSSSRLSR